MELAVDKFGRVVLPKEVRDRLGLQPGSRLSLAVEDRGIRLEPTDASTQIVRNKDGVLVLQGKVR